MIASSGSMLYLYSSVESSLTGARRVICLASQELYSTILDLSVLETLIDDCTRALLLVVDDGGRLSIHSIRSVVDACTSVPFFFFHCILTHRVSRSGVRHNCPWRVAGGLGHVAVLLLDATLLVFRVGEKEKNYGSTPMLLETNDEMFLFPPAAVNLSDALVSPASNNKLKGPKQPHYWEVPHLVSLDLCITLLSESCCFILAKDTYTGVHLLFRVAITDTLSRIRYLIVHPSILAIKKISSGLIGFGSRLILCLSSDFLDADWPAIYPCLHAHREGTSPFDYAEEGELLLNMNALFSHGILDPLRLAGCALFGTYLAVDSEPPGSPSMPSFVFAQEVQFNRNDRCSHVWLLDETGELMSILISTNQSRFILKNILFLSSTIHNSISSALDSNVQTDQFTLHSTGSLSIQAIRAGTLCIDCLGGFLLTCGFLGCITSTGDLSLYRILDLPKGHTLASLSLINQVVQYPIYKDGNPVYPALRLLQLLIQPFTCKKSENVDMLLSSILLHEHSLLISDIIAAAIVLSAPIAADSKYLIANRTSLSLYALSVSTTHVYSGPLFKEEHSSISSAKLHQVMLGSTGYLIFSCEIPDPKEHRRNICMKTTDSGLQFTSHHSSIAYRPSAQSIMCTDWLNIDLSHVSESSTVQSNSTPICLDGKLLNTHVLHSDLILQILEEDEPHRLSLVFVSLCHSSVRKTLSYASQIIECDEYTDDSSFDFPTNKWSSNRARRQEYDDELSGDENISPEPHLYLIFRYECSFNAPVVSVLYCIPTSTTSTQICFQTQTGLTKLSVNIDSLIQLQLQREDSTHILHISRYLPTFMVDAHTPFNPCIKQPCQNLLHVCSDLFLYSNNNALTLYSITPFSTNMDDLEANRTDNSLRHMSSSYVLEDKQSIIDVYLNTHWSVSANCQYIPILVVATDGLHICYIDRKEEKLMDIKSTILVCNLNEYLEATASIFTKGVQLLFGDQGHDSKLLKIHPLSATNTILTCDGLVSYLLTFLIIKDCPIPNHLYRINFSARSLLSIYSLTIKGYLNNYLLGVTADSQFHVFEPLDGMLCPSLTSLKVFAEDSAGLSVYGLTVLKGGYCACIIKSHSNPIKTNLIVMKAMGMIGRARIESDLGVKYSLPLTENTRLLSYDYLSGRLSWADGRSFYIVDNIAKLVSQQIKEIQPAYYSISCELDITALCSLGQSSSSMCIGVSQRLLVYNTITKEILAQELLPDTITRLVPLGSLFIVAVMRKAGLAVFSFSQSKGKLTLEFTDSVPMRIITTILPINPDIIVIGDRMGSISVLSCTPDNRYHHMSVSKKLSLYAEMYVASPVVSLTAEPRRGKSSAIIFHYTLFTGEIGKVELTTDKKLFSKLLCGQETAHLNGLYNPTSSVAGESHRRFRCGPYSFVNTIDVPFLTQTYRMRLLK